MGPERREPATSLGIGRSFQATEENIFQENRLTPRSFSIAEVTHDDVERRSHLAPRGRGPPNKQALYTPELSLYM